MTKKMMSPACRPRRKATRRADDPNRLFSASVVVAFFLVVLSGWVVADDLGGNNAKHNEYVNGDPMCPCALPGQGLQLINPKDLDTELLDDKLGVSVTNVDLETYGVGCGMHDRNTTICSDGDVCVDGDPLSDVGVGCDRSWCERSFCFVDPTNCSLHHSLSEYFQHSGRYYSYATCHDMDSFTQNNRLDSLKGTVLKVGFNHNSGGWKGAYSKEKTHFKGPANIWDGPSIQFVRAAAIKGQFSLNVTAPPEFLRNRSLDFYSSSNFDFCVYAVSLGYLDLCVADYTITDKRAITSNFFLLNNHPLYLIIPNKKVKTGWARFTESLFTVYQPFTSGVWAFIIFFVIPCMGFLFFFHERGKPGSVFPKTEKVLVSDKNSGETTVKELPVPFYKHLIKSIYTTTVGVLKQDYSQSLVTYGGMFNLVGLSFFILTIIAVYTANLAAMLTQESQKFSINSIEDAKRAGLKFCGERKVVQSIMKTYGISNLFVVDPLDMGGDGQPGFTCDKCASRQRVFDFLRETPGDNLYCDVAIAPAEDLQVLQNRGYHCNKTIVGIPIGYVQAGFPVSQSKSIALISLFLTLKNEGVYQDQLKIDEPVNQCLFEERGEGSALNLQDLTGIWITTFFFALLGVAVTLYEPHALKRKEHKPIYAYNQSGQAINTVHDDSEHGIETNVIKLSSAVRAIQFQMSGLSARAIGDADTAMNAEDSGNVAATPKDDTAIPFEKKVSWNPLHSSEQRNDGELPGGELPTAPTKESSVEMKKTNSFMQRLRLVSATSKQDSDRTYMTTSDEGMVETTIDIEMEA